MSDSSSKYGFSIRRLIVCLLVLSGLSIAVMFLLSLAYSGRAHAAEMPRHQSETSSPLSLSEMQTIHDAARGQLASALYYNAEVSANLAEYMLMNFSDETFDADIAVFCAESKAALAFIAQFRILAAELPRYNSTKIETLEWEERFPRIRPLNGCADGTDTTLP